MLAYIYNIFGVIDMNDMEIMTRAKMYVEKLANGINPLTDMEVAENDVVNNVRISRCLFYVADVLGQVLDNGGVHKKSSSKKEPLNLTAEQLVNFEYFAKPVSVSDFVERVNNFIDTNVMKKLKTTSITNWLVDIEMLQVVELPNGKTRKMPTEKGSVLGIITETRMGQYGEYTIVLYDINAQHFIIDNFDAVVEINNQTKSRTNKTNDTSEWTTVHDEVLRDLSQKNFTVSQIADILKRSVEDVNERQKVLGL